MLRATPDEKLPPGKVSNCYEETIVIQIGDRLEEILMPTAISNKTLLKQFIAEKRFLLKKNGKSVDEAFTGDVLGYIKSELDTPMLVLNSDVAEQFFDYRVRKLQEPILYLNNTQNEEILVPRREFFILARTILDKTSFSYSHHNKFREYVKEKEKGDQIFFYNGCGIIFC